MGNRNGRTVGKYTFIFISYLAARDATSSRAREGDAHSSREALKGEELALVAQPLRAPGKKRCVR